jgi:hypothetical protein
MKNAEMPHVVSHKILGGLRICEIEKFHAELADLSAAKIRVICGNQKAEQSK